MARPQILILMHYMELGGAESALLGLLQAHDPQRADVDLFLFAHRGELMEYIPKDKINLLPEIAAYSVLEDPIASLVKRGFWKLAIARLLGKRDASKYHRAEEPNIVYFSEFTCQQKRTVSVLPSISPQKEYDLVISFMTPHYVALDKVKARRRLGWIHTDYTSVFTDTAVELAMWGRLDYIASISSEVGTKFCQVFPSLQSKVISIENILSSTFIRTRSKEYEVDAMHQEEGVVKLLTIGRYCYQKRFDEIGTFCRVTSERLSAISNKRIKWYIIGYGLDSEEAKMRTNISAEGMQDQIVLLGKQVNPYPFIASCDVYVQPSRYEGKSITVREAQILGKPVVISNYPTASSQIESGKDGIIVPFDTEGGAIGLADFIADEKLQSSIKRWVQDHNYGNEEEIEKIYNLL